MIKLQSNDMFFYLGRKYNNYKNLNNYYTCFITSKGKTIPFISNNNEGEIKMKSVGSSIFKNNNSIFFHIPFKNVIYEIKKYNLIEKYKINLGKYSLSDKAFFPPNSEIENFIKFLKNPDIISLYGSIQATDSHIIIPLFSNQKIIGNIWISLNTNKFKIINDKIKVKENTFLPVLPRCTKGDTVICILDGFDFIVSNNKMQIPEINNPKLIMYKIKKF